MSQKQTPSNAKAVVAAVLLIAAAVIAWMQLAPRRGPAVTYAWYYNLESAQLFVDRDMPESTGNSQAVKAAVFSCSTCGDQATHFIGWLEKFTDEARAAQAQLAQQSAVPGAPPPPGAAGPDAATAQLRAGHLIAPPPDAGAAPAWLPIASPQGMNIVAAVTAKCPGSSAPATPCAAR